MSFYQSAKFKKLQSVWYKKLKEDEFLDIEEVEKDRDALKKWDSSYFKRRYHAETFLAKEAYYQRASQFYEDYFDGATHIEARVWGLHADGKSVRAIAIALQIKTWEAHTIVSGIAKIMLGVKSDE